MEGHYYLYWGPLPAVFLALVKSAFGFRATIGDQYLVFAFYVAYVLSGTLLVERMARRLFPKVPLYLVVMAVLVLTLAAPNSFLNGSGQVYQAAIVGGQAFLLTGLVFAFDAVWEGCDAPRPVPTFCERVVLGARARLSLQLGPPGVAPVLANHLFDVARHGSLVERSDP